MCTPIRQQQIFPGPQFPAPKLQGLSIDFEPDREAMWGNSQHHGELWCGLRPPEQPPLRGGEPPHRHPFGGPHSGPHLEDDGSFFL